MVKIYPKESKSAENFNNQDSSVDFNDVKESINLDKMIDSRKSTELDETNDLHKEPLEDDEYFPQYIDEEISGPMYYLGKVETFIKEWITKNRNFIKPIFISFLLLFYHAFLVTALIHDYSKAETFLFLTIFIWLLVIYYKVIKRYFKSILFDQLIKPIVQAYEFIWNINFVRISFYICLPMLIALFLLFDTRNDQKRLSGLAGMGFLFIFMFVFSHNPTRIKWRPVFWGFFLQFIFGLAMLRWDWSRIKFQKVANNIITFLDYTYNGTNFVYGFISEPPNICGMNAPFAFSALQVLIYFGAIVSLLYYFEVMQVIFAKMAWFMQITLKTTATESLYACAVIFVGLGEAPLLIKPYLIRMTPSEIHAIMSSGLACVAGSVFAAYISFGACPAYLLAASVMSAPGSLACSKIMYPETHKSKLQRIEDLELPKGEETNALEAISNGAVIAIELVLAVIANLIVFVALLAFLDSVIAYAGDLIGYEGWSFQLVVGYIFFPLAYIMGVNENAEETLNVAKLMGTKTALNEFVAYQHLSELLSSNPPKLSPRAAMIATYALCSFANFGSVAIQVGILGAMVPKRKSIIAKLSLRALLTGSISSFMTASLAGVLVDNPLLCLPMNSDKGCFDLSKYQEIFNNSTNFNSTQFESLSNFSVHSEF